MPFPGDTSSFSTSLYAPFFSASVGSVLETRPKGPRVLRRASGGIPCFMGIKPRPLLAPCREWEVGGMGAHVHEVAAQCLNTGMEPVFLGGRLAAPGDPAGSPSCSRQALFCL